MKHRPWTGYLLAVIGVIVLLSEIGLHYWGYFHGTEYTLNHPVLYVGLVIGFVGFYMINPKGAEGGTDILTRTVVAVISVIRTGKTATSAASVAVQVTPVHDGKTVPSETTTMEIPTPLPSVTPTKTDDESGP